MQQPKLNEQRQQLEAALAMYERLRQRGRSRSLALLSVQALYSQLTPDQRQELRAKAV